MNRAFVYSLRAAVPLSLGLLVAALVPPQAAAISTTVVISQAYPAGGEAGATWNRDYIVLFNKSLTTVSLAGWTLQAKATTGSVWQAIPLCGSIGSGHFYLVQLAQGGPVGAPLPTPDCGGTINLARNDFTVAVVNNSILLSGPCSSSATIVDLVGWSSGTTCAEGTAVSPSSSPAVAMHRTSPCMDSDNNSADFGLAPANPQNSSATYSCANNPPAIVPVPPLTVDEAASLDQPLSATDPDGNIVTLSLGGQPTFVTLLVDPPNPQAPSTTTGKLRFQPGPNAAEGLPSKQWCFQLVATDNGTPPASSQRTVCVTVNRTNSPPSFTLAPPTTVKMVVGETAQFDLAASDYDMEQQLTFSLVGAPSFAVVTTNPTVPGGGATGQLTLTPGPNDKGKYCCSVRVQDSDASAGFADVPVCVTVHTTVANLPFSGQWPGGVNMATNELSFAEPPDLCLGGPLPLCFGRYYASLLDREGAAAGHVGTNWLGTYDWKLEITPTTETIVDNRGERLAFGILPSGDRVALNHLEEDNKVIIRAFDNVHRLHRGHQRRTYEFDGTSGLLQRILDEHGNSLTCSYSGTGNLLSSVTDGLGRTLTFNYDANNRLIAVGDGTRSVSYGHTGNLLSSFTDAGSHTTTYDYATGTYPGLLGSQTTPIGTTPITYTYGADGGVASWTDAFTNPWTFGVGPGGGCAATTPGGNVWESVHGGALNIESLHDPAGGTTAWAYDTTGRPASVMRPLGDVTTLAYHPASGFPSDLGRADQTHVLLSYGSTPIDGFDVFHLTGASYPDGASESFSYDSMGNLVMHTDRAGEDWIATHNSYGQILTQTNPAGGVTTLTYDPMRRLASHTDNASNTTSFTYDALDRLMHVEHPDETGRDYTYDALDRLTSITDEQGKIWSHAYDYHERLISQTDPLGHAEGFAYDAMDRVTGVTDALGKTKTYAYDEMGRLASTTDRSSRTTMYAYDALNRLAQYTPPGGSPTQFGYDANSRLLTVTDPLGHATTYEYDALDRASLATDPLGTPVDYDYDLMGRLTSASAPLGKTHTYGYDARGLLTSFLDVTSAVQLSRTVLGEVGSIGDPNIKVWPFGYDPQGRTTSKTDPLARSTTFEYDSRNRISHVTTPVGSGDFTYAPTGDALECQWLDATGTVALAYAYDDARRLTAATGATFSYDDADRLISSNGLTFTYDDEGRLASETYASGKTVTYSYNTRGLLSEAADWLGGTTSFTYDAAGRLTGITRPNGTTATYEYDAANRLSQLVEKQPGPVGTPLASITLTRDALGRITNAVRDAPLKPASTASDSTGYSYDDASQVIGFGYDGLGRLLSDGTRSFQWDAAGRLTHYSSGTESPTFTYDAFGRMLTRTGAAGTRQFVWDYATGSPSLAKSQSGPNGLTIFVHSPNGLLYKVDASGKRTFYHFDESGNTMFLTNDGGAVIASYAYTPTGKTTALGYTADNPFTYAGALGALQEGADVFSRFGSTLFETRTAHCISCPAEPLATMGPDQTNPTAGYQVALHAPGDRRRDDAVTSAAPIQTSGMAEILGNDGLISLGGGLTPVIQLAAGGLSGILAMSGLISTGVVPVAPHQTGTMRHEIGHSFDLFHGGDLQKFHQDQVGAETFVSTVPNRYSLREHARLIKYALSPGVASSGNAKVRWQAGTTLHELGHNMEVSHGDPYVLETEISEDGRGNYWGHSDADCDGFVDSPNDGTLPLSAFTALNGAGHRIRVNPRNIYNLWRETMPLGIGGTNLRWPDQTNSFGEWYFLRLRFSCTTRFVE